MILFVPTDFLKLWEYVLAVCTLCELDKDDPVSESGGQERGD